MRHFAVNSTDQIVVIGLDTGEDLLKAVKEVIVQRDIVNGVVISGVGSLSKARYHIVEPGDAKPWKDVFIEKDGTIEIVSISGIIADREPHLHICLAQNDQAYGGHLEEGCIILTLAEIAILPVRGQMKRIVGSRGFGQIQG